LILAFKIIEPGAIIISPQMYIVMYTNKKDVLQYSYTYQNYITEDVTHVYRLPFSYNYYGDYNIIIMKYKILNIEIIVRIFSMKFYMLMKQYVKILYFKF
jgi:hypothetical protein